MGGGGGGFEPPFIFINHLQNQPKFKKGWLITRLRLGVGAGCGEDQNFVQR